MADPGGYGLSRIYGHREALSMVKLYDRSVALIGRIASWQIDGPMPTTIDYREVIEEARAICAGIKELS